MAEKGRHISHLESKPKRRRVRTPSTVLNSEYSIPTRNRIRVGLASYRHRFGLSYEALVDRILNAFPLGSDLFSNIETIKEFLNGAETSDARLKLIILFLKKEMSDFSESISEEGFVHVVGDIFTQLFLPCFGKVDYERALQSQESKKWSGVYVRRARDSMDMFEFPWASAIAFRHIANTPYLLVEKFKVVASVTDYKSIRVNKHVERFIDYLISMPTRDIIIARDGLNYSEYLSDLLDGAFDTVDLDDSCRNFMQIQTTHKGLMFPQAECPFFFVREIARRNPSYGVMNKVGIIDKVHNSDLIINFSEIDINNPPIYDTKKDAFLSGDVTSLGKSELYIPVKSKYLDYAVQNIPWGL